MIDDWCFFKGNHSENRFIRRNLGIFPACSQLGMIQFLVVSTGQPWFDTNIFKNTIDKIVVS
jgi:hypothetical protein